MGVGKELSLSEIHGLIGEGERAKHFKKLRE
jgi:hypothetical protein